MVWYEKHEKIKGYKALEGIPRTAPGNDCRQRPKESGDVPALSADQYQEDWIACLALASTYMQPSIAIAILRAGV